jgi:hypothetical protein
MCLLPRPFTRLRGPIGIVLLLEFTRIGGTLSWGTGQMSFRPKAAFVTKVIVCPGQKE